MINELKKPILNGGIKSIYFFNGRLLSGEDLSQEQLANRQSRELLGQGLGDGVGYGLEVQETVGVSLKQTPVVSVSPGLAINRLGQTIRLPAPVDVALARPLQGGGGNVNALFADCRPLQSGQYSVGAGVYLLTILPASGLDGKAPVSGLGNLDAACNARYQVDGVSFRLIQLDISAAMLNDPARLRNRLAYHCFGANDSDVSGFFANPFGPIVNTYGLLDDLRPACLEDVEVPLAMVFWTVADGLKFIDLWSVRRRITRPSPDPALYLITSDRRLAEGEARFLQFQAQIEEMRTDPKENLSTVHAEDRFKYFPPVGIIPVTIDNTTPGLKWKTFFGDLGPDELELMDADQLQPLINASYHHQPLAVTDTSSGTLTLYRIRENVDAVQSGTASQLAVVFARPGMVYLGRSRLDYAVWDKNRFE